MEMTARKNKVKEGSRITRTVFFLIIVLCNIVVLFPVMNVISVSISSYASYTRNPNMILPTEISFQAYKTVFQNAKILSGYATTIIVTVCGTLLGVTLTVLSAYALSKPYLKGRKILMPLILFTMFFSGGMIPNYLLMRGLDLLDKRAALIIPGCLTAYNLILMKNFFESLPVSLMEAARIDGATEPQILTKIVIPLSKPIISVITLFLAVEYWNNYFNGILYMKSQSKWPLQLVLRELITTMSAITEASGGNLAETAGTAAPPIMLQYAAIVVAMVPILCVYPFIQKYFEKGILMGAVKG